MDPMLEIAQGVLSAERIFDRFPAEIYGEIEKELTHPRRNDARSTRVRSSYRLEQPLPFFIGKEPPYGHADREKWLDNLSRAMRLQRFIDKAFRAIYGRGVSYCEWGVAKSLRKSDVPKLNPFGEPGHSICQRAGCGKSFKPERINARFCLDCRGSYALRKETPGFIEKNRGRAREGMAASRKLAKKKPNLTRPLKDRKRRKKGVNG